MINIDSETELEAIAVRIGQLRKAEPGTPEAAERKKMMQALLAFEKKSNRTIDANISTQPNLN
ncbi:MAG: hypothetical protein COW65_18860 [Cytophagales bacterium CG18_big_fil_WC_8_21_14_2_50_42_9]|nr:MAG: hypothetical protein COW65_18860 [Cytophagales bacterium CG18_big_fil_WC_8_21_14_2_50_42_9]